MWAGLVEAREEAAAAPADDKAERLADRVIRWVAAMGAKGRGVAGTGWQLSGESGTHALGWRSRQRFGETVNARL
jgi:hypothetical protein